MAKKILDTVIFLANHLTWLTARGRGDILKVFNMEIMKTRSDCRDKVFCFIVFFIVDFSFYTGLLWNCQEDFQKRRSWMLVKPSPQCTQPNMILSGACKCWKKTNKKSFKDYFVHACTVCLYFSMLMYNSHILYVSSGYIKVGHYTKHKDSTTITISMNKRKARKRKCRRLPARGSMRCKINFPTCCQFVYHSDCLFNDYKDASSFFELPVVSAVLYLIFLYLIFLYLNKQNSEREEKEERARSGVKERKWEGHHIAL